MIFHTIGGSTYEVNSDKKQFRRLAGQRKSLIGKDGEFNNYILCNIKVNEEALFFLESSDPHRAPYLRTSIVKYIEE